MEELAKKIIEIGGIQYVPWKDVVEFLEATKTETLKEGLSEMEKALEELRNSLSHLNEVKI